MPTTFSKDVEYASERGHSPFECMIRLLAAFIERSGKTAEEAHIPTVSTWVAICSKGTQH